MRSPAVAPQSAASTPRSPCTGETKSGAACQAFALPGRPFCLTHDPDRAADATAARSKGAAVSNRLRSIEGKRQKLDTVSALVEFTGGVIQDVLEGTVLPDVARVCLYGVSIQRQLLEASDLEQRLAALEAREPAQHPQKGQHQWGR